MSPAIEQLYDYFVGQPRPERWPEELQGNPMLAHGQYAFSEGLRLGYLLTANTPLLEAAAAAGQPWSVSTVAQAAGIAACGCRDWPRKGREVLAVERPALLKGLRDLGLTVWEGSANYLLFRAQGNIPLKERLEERDILIRSCANYPGLGPEYYRVAVRTAPDNAILLRALKEAL